MSDREAEMSFWDHLEELRWTIFRCIIALVVFTVGGFIFMRFIFNEIIMWPTHSDFILYKILFKLSTLAPIFPDFFQQEVNVDIVNIKLATQFLTHITTSFWLALLLTFPYLMYELWKFVSPALYENEKKSVRWVFFFGTIMFFIGCSVGYFLVFPMAFRFLGMYELSEVIKQQVSLESYMETFLTLIFIMGIVFEMPLVCWLLSKLGLLKRSFFNKYRRHAIVGLLLVAAIITPGGDPFTLAVVFFPLYGLYELSAIFVKKAPKKDEDESSDVVKYGTE